MNETFVAGEGILSALIGQLFYYNALKYGEASKIVPICSSFPLITVILAIVFLNEQFTPYSLTNVFCISP
ncbi:MAG TPA: EamA family transporter [Thermoanaerobacterales bacterium]|nr:EamA family transporter [Thermoanaerobacterales bacterium]